MNGKLALYVMDPFGREFGYHIALSEDVMQEIFVVPPPGPISTFEETVTVLKRRQMRKDLFIREATRLGTLLAEHMEDKEGWHGPDRQENLKGIDVRKP